MAAVAVRNRCKGCSTTLNLKAESSIKFSLTQALFEIENLTVAYMTCVQLQQSDGSLYKMCNNTQTISSRSPLRQIYYHFEPILRRSNTELKCPATFLATP